MDILRKFIDINKITAKKLLGVRIAKQHSTDSAIYGFVKIKR